MREQPPALPEPVVVTVGPGVTVTVLVTGWIAVRPAHRAFAGPDALALPAILAGRGWTEWMPINAFLVEHPQRRVLVDTGEGQDRPPGHFGCGSAGQERFYRTFLRLAVPPEAALPRRLAELGVHPADIETVVLTHLHSDHTGNLSAFPGAGVLVGAQENQAYRGATACRLPARTEAARWEDGPAGGFPRTQALTDDASVRSIRLPGHTPGHQGLLVLGPDGPVVIGGDAAFSPEQVRGGPPPGIAVDRPANRATQRALADLLGTGGVLLLSHRLPTDTEQPPKRSVA